MDYFTLDGVDCRVFNSYPTNNNGRLRSFIPSRSTKTEQLAGVDGYIFLEDIFDKRDMTINLLVLDTSEENLEMLRNWLSKRGVRDLVFSFEPYRKYNVFVTSPITFEEYTDGMYGSFSVQTVSPYAFSLFTTENIDEFLVYDQFYYYDAGLYYIDDMPGTGYNYTNPTSGDVFQIYHGGNTDFAKPKIKITGSANEIIFEQFSDSALTNKVAELSYGFFSGELVIDCNLFTCFLDGAVDNGQFNGEYFNLIGKKMPTTLSSGNPVNFTSNTIEIPSTKSPVDDFYNGYTIVLFNSEQREFFTVTDYDGATKTITFDGVIDFGGELFSYYIYAEQDGLNYIRMTGNSLNITNITFDFPFVYI